MVGKLFIRAETEDKQPPASARSTTRVPEMTDKTSTARKLSPNIVAGKLYLIIYIKIIFNINVQIVSKIYLIGSFVKLKFVSCKRG